MIPDAAGLKSPRGVVLQFSINFYRFATPRGASADLFRVLVYVHTNIQVPKIPAAALTVGRVQEDSI